MITSTSETKRSGSRLREQRERTDAAEQRAGNSLLISTWRLFGAGLQTPPSAGPEVSRRGRGWRPSVGEVARSGDLATTLWISPRRTFARILPWLSGTNHQG